MNRFRSFAAGMTACLLLSGCSSVYLHDEGLKTSTGKAHEALAGVTPLKPFDDQLANLEQFAQREDLAVADYWTTVRDKHFDGLLLARKDRRSGIMEAHVNSRLTTLFGTPGAAVLDKLPGLLAARDKAIETKGIADARAEGQRRRHLSEKANEAAAALPPARGRPGKPPAAGVDRPDLSCETMIAVPQSENDRLRRGKPSERALGDLIATCRQAGRAEQTIAKVTTALNAGLGGLARTVLAAQIEAQKATETKLSDRALRIQQTIKDAKTFQEETSGEANLTKLRDDIRGILAGLGAATEAAGWEEADNVVHALLRAEICDAAQDSVDEETRTKAECPKIDPESTTGRAQAGWAFVKALTLIQDASASERRGVNWLVAAKAIIAAEKADAALRLAEQKARATLLRQQFDLMLVEGTGLINSGTWLATRLGGSGLIPRERDCWGALKASRRRANEDCAFAAYVDAWNHGRLPAEVLTFKLVQVEREFAVRRSRAVAEKQYALAVAAASTLKQYGEGGIMPAAVAQTLLDLTTIGVIN